MIKKFLKGIVVMVLFIFLLVFFVLLKAYIFYSSVFVLSYDQVEKYMDTKPNQCKKLVDCKLLPGDIIIRRYVTKVSELFDETLNPYFTHSAVYLGNGELFEAVGNYTTPENQIVISKLSESAWYNQDMKNFVVIRPKNYYGKLDYTISGLTNIANDPEYVFGPLNETKKTASCSDIILKYLVDDKIVRNSYINPPIITPDYLFWKIENDSKNFEIIGYSIDKK